MGILILLGIALFLFVVVFAVLFAKTSLFDVVINKVLSGTMEPSRAFVLVVGGGLLAGFVIFLAVDLPKSRTGDSVVVNFATTTSTAVFGGDLPGGGLFIDE